MIRHIWFDMAGTLYRETPAFDAVHDKLRYETYAAITGTPIDKAKEKYDQLYAQYGSNSAVFRALGKPSDFWQQTFDSMDLASLIKPDPDITETITMLSKSVPISLFGNFKQVKIEEVLKLLSIDKVLFTHILSGDDVTHRKPDLEGFHKMVELSNLPPGDLLYAGDRIDVDIKPAKAVGMQTALVWQVSSEADHSFENFTDLLTLV